MRTLALLAALALQGDPPATPLQKALNDLEPRGAWHYDDLAGGLAEARRTGKPLLVVLRCPP
jgi:hypothetical protein